MNLNTDDVKPVQPTEFQELIANLSFADFVNKTNIKELIQIDYREKSNVDQDLPEKELQETLRALFKNIRLYHCWPFSPLKNIRFKQSLSGDDPPKTNNRPGPSGSAIEKPEAQSKMKHIPTQFQLEISELSIEEFEYGPNGFFTTFPKKKVIPPAHYRKNLNTQYQFARQPKGYQMWSKGFLKDLQWKQADEHAELDSLHSGLSEVMMQN